MAHEESETDTVTGTFSGITAALAWLLIAIGDGLAVWRGYVAVTLYRQGLRDRLFDPPAAQLAYAHARSAGSVAAVGLLLAAVGMALLLRAARRQ